MDRLQLIAEIYSRPGLWDFHSEDYKDRTCYQKLWDEVAANMGGNATVDECKRKWKNLRDAYRAELKRIEIRIDKDILRGRYDPNNKYVSKWSYFKHLKFIKDIKRPLRDSFKGNLNMSSNDFCADDENRWEDLTEFHSIDNIKLEADAEANNDTYSLNEEDNSSNSQICYPKKPLEENEKQHNQSHTEIPSQAAPSRIEAISFEKLQKSIDVKPLPSSCKCLKRSYGQMNFLENLEKEEETLMKSTRLDITRSNNLDHVGDSDYNFLVSFLPQLKKMNELQNLQFRSKMTHIMLSIMSQSITAATSLQNKI